MYKKLVLLSLVVVLGTAGGAFAADQKGTILFEWFDGTSGGNLDEATDGRNADYPDNPSEVDWLTVFQGPTNRAEAFMTRVRGYVYPPATGDYTFWTASDDHSRVFLSTNDDPANTSQVCYVEGWTGALGWTEQTSQKSSAITLQANQKYYIEVLHRDGNGGDHLAVGWSGPGIGASAVVINGQYLSPFIRSQDLIAHTPDPADGAIVSATYKSLQWQAGANATSHDVYFGTDYDSVAAGAGNTFQGNQTTKYFIVGFAPYALPDGLVPGTSYYWRIDEVEADGVTKHTGDVWSFFVPPYKAYDPQPADGVRFVDVDTDLTWSVGYGAGMHMVFIDTDPDVVANAVMGEMSVQSTYDPGTLNADTTYYWRVDETNPGTGTTTKGDVWSFKTTPNIPITDPNLVCWYKLDENMGLTAVDWSGHGNHGTLLNGGTWLTEGYDGGALQFDGTDDYVDTGITTNLSKYTACCWVKSPASPAATAATGPLHREGNYQINWNHTDASYQGAAAMNAGDTWVAASFGSLQSNTWYHLCATYDGTSLKAYNNGVLITTTPAAAPSAESNSLKLGRHAAAAQYFNGIVDDARVYDHALSIDDIRNAMRGDPRLAWNADPAGGSTVDIRDISSLSWSAGNFASQHDVYWGGSKSAVEDADTTSSQYKGRQTALSYSLAGLVEFGGGPYYWRIDEFNTDSTVNKGRIWSFSVADYFVIENVEDYNDEPPDRVFETWIDGFGGSTNGSIAGYPYPVFADGEHFCEISIVHSGKQSMPFFYNNNMKYSEITKTLVSPNRDWTQSSVKALSLWYYGHIQSQGSFVEGPTGTYTMTGAGSDIYNVGTAGNYGDEFHYAWKSLGAGSAEIIAKVSAPTGENMNGWAKAGVMIRETLEPNSPHAFMCLTNTQGVAFQYREEVGGDSASTQQAGISGRPQWLRLTKDIGGTFTAYHANDVGGTHGVWTQVDTYPIQMNTPCYIGLALTSHQDSVPATATFSNITITGAVSGATFTNQDIGIQSSDPERMYVMIRDAAGQMATVYNPDPLMANVTTWTEWGQYGEGIPLTAFTDANPSLNLANIDSISLGFGTRGNTTQPGGSGLVFFDDIRLYRGRCVSELAKPANDYNSNCVVDMPDLEMLTDNWLINNYEVAPMVPGTSGLLASYQFQNNLLDSSGNANHGDPCGTPSYVAGQTGNAIELDGLTDGIVTRKSFLSNLSEFTLAGWVSAANADEARIGLFGQNDCIEFGLNNGTLNTWTAEGGSVVASWPFDDLSWHHVALIGNGASLRTYIDGLLAGSGGITTSSYGSSTFGFNIGTGVWDATGNWFSGRIDEVRAYNRALSQEEVASLAGKTATFTQPLYLLLTPQDANMDNNSDGVIDFKDYAGLIDTWLDEVLWP